MAIQSFHGTQEEFEGPFQLSERGSFGAGIYSGDMRCAVEWADCCGGIVMELSVELANPYYYTVDYDDAVDLDSPAVPLIRDIFNTSEQAILIQESMDSDALFGDDVKDRLLALGHDGLIADFGDGAYEFVAFNPEAVTVVGTHTVEECRQFIRDQSVKKVSSGPRM